MLKIQDSYEVDVIHPTLDLQSLILLYQPLVGKEAIAFYLACFADFGNHEVKDHQRLSKNLNMSITEIEKARKVCEEFQLVRVFVKEETRYLYQIQAPLGGVEFLNNKIFSRLLLKTIGAQEYKTTSFLFFKNKKDVKNFEEITESFNKERLLFWDEAQEVKYNQLKSNFTLDTQRIETRFNYQKLMQLVTPLTFPLESRTEENLKIIGEYAQLYGISEQRMKVLIGRCINLSENQLDVERLKKLCTIENPSIDPTEEDPYSWSPSSFLQSKQNGIPLTPGDKDLLAYLGIEMKLPPVVINVLIDYVLKNNENRLSRRYVQAIAAQWVRSNVNTKEKAIEMTKKVSHFHPAKTKSVLPEYLKEVKKVEGKTVSQEERENLLKLLEEVDG